MPDVGIPLAPDRSLAREIKAGQGGCTGGYTGGTLDRGHFDIANRSGDRTCVSPALQGNRAQNIHRRATAQLGIPDAPPLSLPGRRVKVVSCHPDGGTPESESLGQARRRANLGARIDHVRVERDRLAGARAFVDRIAIVLCVLALDITGRFFLRRGRGFSPLPRQDHGISIVGLPVRRCISAYRCATRIENPSSHDRRNSVGLNGRS